MRGLDLSKGALIATAVASLIATAGCNSDDEKDGTGTQADQIRCLGGNECAGMSECAGGPGGSECAGLNECMGQGWVYTDGADECVDKGGMPEA
jgi:uncharacterized membrane protein